MKVGILGGRFDPPHVGHLTAAKKALFKYGISEVWFVPYNERNLDKVKSEKFPHASLRASKVKSSNNLQRLEMVRLAILGEKRFRVLDMEIKRGGVSYTIDTVLELKKIYPDHEFFWIIGEDLTSELPKWKEYKRLIREIKFITVKNIIAGKNKISSSEIRERVSKGLAISGMVGEEVEKYIEKHRLYK